MEELVSQLPDGNKLNNQVASFLKESLGKSKYQREESKIKWLMEIWKLSDKASPLKTSLVSNFEKFLQDPDNIHRLKDEKVSILANIFKNYSTQELIHLFETLDEKILDPRTKEMLEEMGIPYNTEDSDEDSLNIDEVVHIVNDIDSDIAAKVLEWLEPEEAKGVFKEIHSSKTAEIFAESNFLVSHYLTDENLELDNELVGKIVQNLNTEKLDSDVSFR